MKIHGKNRWLLLTVLIMILVSVWNVPVLAAESGTYTINNGESYIFENIGTIAYSISGLSEAVDYVVYYQDGSVKDYNCNQKPSTLSVPAGGKAVITSISKTLNAVVEDDYFIVKASSEPAMRKIVAGSCESYIFTNISDVPYNLLTDKQYYDYVIYNANGTIVKYQYAATEAAIEVPAHYSIKVTTGSYAATFNLIYDRFEVAETDTPVMNRSLLDCGDTVTYKNTGDTSYLLICNGYIGHRCYDYAIYDPNGNVIEYKSSVYQTSVEVPANYSVRVTATTSATGALGAVSVMGVSEVFESERSDTPTMRKVGVASGETYIFTNVDNAVHSLLSNGYIGHYYYDYVIYDENGAMQSYAKSSYASSIEILPGYSIKVTTTSTNPVTFKGAYVAFEATRSNKPVMKQLIAAPGESFSFINVGNGSCSLLSTGYIGQRIYSYVLYDADGFTVKTVDYTYDSNISVPEGGKITVTVLGNNDIEFKGVYSNFEVVDSILLRSSYHITNIGNSDNTLILKDGYAFDYALYSASDLFISCGTVSAEGLTIPAGGHAIITPRSTEEYPFTENEELTIESYSQPTFLYTYLDAGESCRYTNLSTEDRSVFISGIACSYVVYNANGTCIEEKSNDTASSVTVPSGGNVLVTAYAPLYVKGLSTDFTEEQAQAEAFEYLIADQMQTYLIKNKSVMDEQILILGTPFDYAIYDANNSVVNIAMNSTASSLTVPAGCACAITPLSSDLTIYMRNNTFEYVERSYPVAKRFPIYFGTAVTIANHANTAQTLYGTATSYIEYALMDSSGELQEAKRLVKPSTLTIPAGGSVQIISQASNVIYGGLYEAFSGEDTSVKVTGVSLSTTALTMNVGDQNVLRATVQPTNATNKEVSWSSSAPQIVTVAQSGKITALSTGRAVITVTTADGGYSDTCTIVVGGDTTHTPGDINNDGEVNNKDVTCLLQHLSGMDVEVVEAALDVNGDGAVNNKDVTVLFQYLADQDVEIH